MINCLMNETQETREQDRMKEILPFPGFILYSPHSLRKLGTVSLGMPCSMAWVSIWFWIILASCQFKWSWRFFWCSLNVTQSTNLEMALSIVICTFLSHLYFCLVCLVLSRYFWLGLISMMILAKVRDKEGNDRWWWEQNPEELDLFIFIWDEGRRTMNWTGSNHKGFCL